MDILSSPFDELAAVFASGQGPRFAGSVRAVGTVELLLDYLEFAICHILCVRMVYPREVFSSDIHKFSMNLVAFKDPFLRRYMENNMTLVKEAFVSGRLDRVVLCIIHTSTGETVERWQFSLEQASASRSGHAKEATSSSRLAGSPDSAALQALHSEISQALKQIGVSFLPVLESGCSFKILLYTSKETELPATWTKAHPHFVEKSLEEQLDMRIVHSSAGAITSSVSYRNPDMVSS